MDDSSHPPRSLGQLLHSLIAAREMFAVGARRGLGITIHESLLITALLEYGDENAMSIPALSRVLGVSGTSIANLAKRLEHGGFVERMPDPTDRRRRRLLVRVTPDSMDSWNELFSPVRNKLDELEASFDIAQLATIAQYLREAATAFQDRTEPESPTITEITEAAGAAASSIDALGALADARSSDVS